MIVHLLRVDNFKRFSDQSLDLKEGLNIIKGPNESGKTTLVQALLALLYWRPNARSQEVLSYSAWGRPEGFRISGVFESPGGKWTLSKDFARHTALLERGGEKLRDLERIEEWVASETGLPGEGLYRATACIGHDQMAMLERGKGELEEALQASVTGGASGKSARKVINELQQHRKDLEKGTDRPARKPGPIAAIRGQLTRLEKEQADLRGKVEQLHLDRDRDRELRRERESLEEELAALQRVQGSFQERLSLENELAELRERFAELSRMEEMRKRRDQLLSERKRRYGDLEEALKDKGEWLERAASRRRSLQESIERLEEERSKLERSPMRMPGGRAWLTILGAALLLAGAVGAFFRPLLAILIAVGAALLLAGFRERKAREAEGRRLAIASLDTQIRDMRIEIASLERSERELLGQVGASSAGDLQEAQDSLIALLDEQRDLENRLEALARGRSREDLENELRELATSIGVKERLLEERRGEGIEPAHDQRAGVRRERLQARLDEVRRELVRLQVRLEEGAGREERLLEVEEEMAALKEELETLERRALAYRLAEEWMEKALAAVVDRVKESVQERVGELVSAMTGGRYRRVRIDGDFRLHAHSPEKGDEVPVEKLSRGTVDQAYLGARLALLESICGERRPPLLLDDPFVTFDSERAGYALSMLREYSRRNQVLLFTCGDHYDEYADHIIDLSR